MQQALILSGSALLFLAFGLNFYWGRQRLKRRASGTGALVRRASLRSIRRTQRLLKTAASAAADTHHAAAFAAYTLEILQSLHQLRSRMKNAPRILSGQAQLGQLLHLAGTAAAQGDYSPDELAGALSSDADSVFQPSHIALFPHFVALAQTERLGDALERFIREHQPSTTLPSDSSEDALSIAESLRQSAECLGAMQRVNWLVHAEEADPIHHLLLNDPAGVYPRMTASARLSLRRQTEAFSAHTVIEHAAAVKAALELSQRAEAGTLEAYVGYWFQDAKGLKQLYRTTAARRGRLYIAFAERRELVRYILLWIAGILAGFVFLQAGNPVFMLPWFALCAGEVIRRFVKVSSIQELPAMEVQDISPELRTLVVLPATLHDPDEAIAAVRRLKTTIPAFPQEGVDFLLLGDFDANMTALSSLDAPIIQTACEALNALESSRCLYLQRGRTWDAERHTYCARGGARGAVRELCRLIAQGEIEDVVAFSTAEAAYFGRRYAYVLVMPQTGLPTPGVLEKLLSVMIHPLNTRYPEGDAWRGYAVLSPEGSSTFDGFVLIRPDAFLEATDGLVSPQQESALLAGELAGHASVPGARMESSTAQTAWDAAFSACKQSWCDFRWQLPWVKTPMGIIRNPLRFFGRFQLREQLRHSLSPAARCILLLWALLTQSWLLLLLAIVTPDALKLPRSIRDVIQAACTLSLLPMEAAVHVTGAAATFRREGDMPVWANLEVWVQGIAATILAALGIGIPAMALPAFALAVMFACFPLSHRCQNAPLRSSPGLTDAHFAMLEQAAAATWRYFQKLTAEDAWPLPPCAVQYEPPLGTEAAATPASTGACLLAFICAKELGVLDANQAATSIERIVTGLQALPMPFGLPCRSYALPELTVQDARVDAAETGFLLCALMTAAQALRTWLPDLAEEHIGLSRSVQALADGFDVSRLYDREAHLFHAGLDEAGQGTGYVQCLTDAALLLSIAARARRDIPPEHFFHLDFTCIRMNGNAVPLTRTGSAAELLPALFFPSDTELLESFVDAMKKRSAAGLWGLGECAYYGFDAALKYSKGRFGMQEAALEAAEARPVYAPYATALGLLISPHEAANALLHFQEIGALGPQGFCDAVDCTQGTALIGLHDTFHQGILLMALTHVLTDAPLQRYFCALPEVEACLPLLRRKSPDMLIPSFALIRPEHSEPQSQEYVVNPMAEPVAKSRLGTDSSHMLIDSRGCSCIYDGATPLLRHTENTLHGVQFYLVDEGRVYRIGDVLLSGQTVFAPGEVRQESLCGSLKAELVSTVDIIRRRTLHILKITNLSTRDRVIEAADLLLPDPDVPADSFQPELTAEGRLALHARCSGRTLYHTADFASHPLASCACTDASHFLSRSGSLHRPGSLSAPMEDQVVPSEMPCMSFRVKLSLCGRGQTTLWFTTSLVQSEPPRLTELDGFRRLAALQHEAMAPEAASGIPPEAVSLRTLPSTHWKAPAPALTPDMELIYPGLFGGFDPQTEDYVVLLAPDVSTPCPWTNTHFTRYYHENVDENGFCGENREQVWIRIADDVLLSPWSSALPRSVRMETGITIWDAWSDQLDVRLCACCVPTRRFGMRVLRIRNATESAITLRVYVQKHFSSADSLALLPSGVMAIGSAYGGLQPCIGGNGWTVRRTFPTEVFSDSPVLDMPDEEDGTVALLEMQLELPPHTNKEAIWISGFARHDEDYELALRELAPGASAVLRSVKAVWAQRLSRISCSTPEDTLDLMFNRILPVQALTDEGAAFVHAALHIAPAEAKRRLLHLAMHAHTRDEWVSVALLAADCVEITGTKDVLNVRLPRQDTSLFECCRKALLEPPLDRNFLPLGEKSTQHCLRYALAAKRLHEVCPDEDLAEYSRKLLHAADTYLWKNGCYGEPLELEAQCLACEAFGANQRIRQAVLTAWDALYEQPFGLLRAHAPTDTPTLPGLPGNGGMNTAQAALCIRALIRTGHTDHAFELLRALNPLHHTDTPERQKVFCGAPYLLHGGMNASPMQPGRADPSGGSRAAALLYSVILQDILGLKRRGNLIRVQPTVPPEWVDFTLTLQENTTTWYITLERRAKAMTVDGDECTEDAFTLTDDGKIHQVRIPLE